MVEIQEEWGELSIRKGVRQGCYLSLPLFNLYSEEKFNGITEKTKNIGVKVYGKTIQILRFANNIAPLANIERELEETLNI